MADTTTLSRPSAAPLPASRPSTRLRNIELGLLLLALSVAAGAIVLVQLGALGRIDLSVVKLAGGVGVLALALHVVLRFLARDADPFILPIATALNGLGIAEIYRIDISPTGVKNGWDDGTHQILWTALGIGAARQAPAGGGTGRPAARFSRCRPSPRFRRRGRRCVPSRRRPGRRGRAGEGFRS